MPYTFQEEVSNGVQTVYPVDFDFQTTDTVFVYSGEHHEFAEQLSYRWQGNAIELTNLTELPLGTKFYIRRIVPRDALIHIFENKATRGKYIDGENYHLLYLAQEYADGFWSIGTLHSLRSDMSMTDHRIANVKDGVEEGDAINLRQAKALVANYAEITVDEIDSIETKLRLLPAVLQAEGYSGRFGVFDLGMTVIDRGDTCLDSNNKLWKYIGTPIPYTIPAGSVPDAEWELVDFVSKIDWEAEGTTFEEVAAAGRRTQEYLGQVAGAGGVVLAHEVGLETGVANLEAKIVAAAQNAAAQGAVLEFRRDITIPSDVLITGNVALRTAEGCTITMIDGGIECRSSNELLTTPVTQIINSYLPGTPYLPDTVIAGMSAGKITFSSSNHGLVAGDYIKLATDDMYPWINFEAKRGEVAIVAYVYDNVVWVDRNLKDTDYDKVFKFSTDECYVDLRMRNVSDAGAGGTLCYIRNYVRPRGKLVVEEGNYQAMVSAGNIEANLTVHAFNLRNFNVPRTKFGYGLVDKNSYNSHYTVMATRVRHGYTTTHGGPGTTADCYGEATDNVVEGVGTFCITPWDTHASGESILFRNCISLHSLGVGFSNRSNNTVYENCHTTGTSDAGWQNFDGEPSTILVGHNKKVTLRNCTSKGHKRGLKSVSNTKKDLDTHRFKVVLENVTFEGAMYTELLLLRNTVCEYSGLVLESTGSNGSVTTSTWSDSNPYFIRAYCTVINSSFSGRDLTMRATGSAQYIYPFKIEVDRSQNAEAINQVTTDGIYLDNSVRKQFYNFAELFITSHMHGRTPSDGPVDYITGLEYNYLSVEGLMLHSKNIDDLMHKNVQEAFYQMSTGNKRGFYYVNTKPPLVASPIYRNAHRMDYIRVSTHDKWDYADHYERIDFHSTNEKHIVIRCLPITPDGATGTAAIKLSLFGTFAGAEAAGQMITIINDHWQGTVAVTAPFVTPDDETPKGQGLVAQLIYNGAGKFLRIQ